MKDQLVKNKPAKQLKEPILKISAILLVLWSALAAYSFYWNSKHLQEESLSLAISEARSSWDKDQAFRGWATRHGGIYVKPNERTPPNPYLAHIPNRDVVTTDGVKLTLMNPAYMMRQMTEEYEKTFGVKGSITGKILLNPINKADAWELRALDEFEKGVAEVFEKTNIDDKAYVRLMKPMYMKKGCVKCHGHLGFKDGDLRGGVSISVPLDKYEQAAAESVRAAEITHAGVWFIGCLGIAGFALSAQKRQLIRTGLQTEIERHQNILEQRVEERTEELRASQARAHHANKLASLGEMAGGMAHEINNPLQSIMLIANRLKKTGSKDNDNSLTDDMDRINISTNQISEIIESLRKMSRDSSNDSFEKVSVKVIVDDVLGITAERYNLKQIKFTVNYVEHCEDAMLYCQRLQIGQVLVNLLNNATDAIADLNDKWIKLEISVADNSIMFSVTDSGRDISADENKMFEPMYTTKSIGEGTGLGLSISSEIVRNHNGSLFLDKKSEYTRFVAQLPINGKSDTE